MNNTNTVQFHKTLPSMQNTKTSITSATPEKGQCQIKLSGPPLRTRMQVAPLKTMIFQQPHMMDRRHFSALSLNRVPNGTDLNNKCSLGGFLSRHLFVHYGWGWFQAGWHLSLGGCVLGGGAVAIVANCKSGLEVIDGFDVFRYFDLEFFFMWLMWIKALKNFFKEF